MELLLSLLLLNLLLAAPSFGAGLHQVEGGALGCADSLAPVVDLSNLGIHLDVKLLRLGNLLMPVVNKLVHPCSERLSYKGVDDVDYVLSWKLLHLMLVLGKGLHAFREFLGELEESFNLQSFVLWHVEVLHLFALDSLSLSRDQVPHVPDGHSVVRAEVCANLVRKEVVHLLLVPHLRSEVFGCYLNLRLR